MYWDILVLCMLQFLQRNRCLPNCRTWTHLFTWPLNKSRQRWLESFWLTAALAVHLSTTRTKWDCYACCHICMLSYVVFLQCTYFFLHAVALYQDVYLWLAGLVIQYDFSLLNESHSLRTEWQCTHFRQLHINHICHSFCQYTLHLSSFIGWAFVPRCIVVVDWSRYSRRLLMLKESHLSESRTGYRVTVAYIFSNFILSVTLIFITHSVCL